MRDERFPNFWGREDSLFADMFILVNLVSPPNYYGSSCMQLFSKPNYTIFDKSPKPAGRDKILLE